MGRRFVDMRTIAQRMQFKDDRINRALAKQRAHDMPETLAKIPSTTAPAVTSDHRQLILTTIAKDATPAEFELFLYDNARQGVHPLDKLILFTKRAGKYTPITSIDFMRQRAAETGECAGSDDAVFAGTPKRGDFTATVTVWRLVGSGRYAFTATARWTEYKPDANDFMWQKMPHVMLGKCAEALALRKAFPKQLAGLYASEELDQSSPAPSRGLEPAREPTAMSSPEAPANLNRAIPDSWKPFVTGELQTGTIVDLDTESKAGRKSGSPYTKTTLRFWPDGVPIDRSVELYTLSLELGAAALAHKTAGDRVTVTTKDTPRGQEIVTLEVAHDAAF